MNYSNGDSQSHHYHSIYVRYVFNGKLLFPLNKSKRNRENGKRQKRYESNLNSFVMKIVSMKIAPIILNSSFGVDVRFAFVCFFSRLFSFPCITFHFILSIVSAWTLFTGKLSHQSIIVVDAIVVILGIRILCFCEWNGTEWKSNFACTTLISIALFLSRTRALPFVRFTSHGD